MECLILSFIQLYLIEKYLFYTYISISNRGIKIIQYGNEEYVKHLLKNKQHSHLQYNYIFYCVG